MMRKREREKYAWVLDYLPYGHPSDSRPVYQKRPLAQAIGERHFTLVELVPKENMVPELFNRVYIGDGEREVIDHVRRRISYEELTHGAQVELPFVIEEIVENDEPRFLEFFNKAQPLTTRLHMLELLPGIGKKLMWGVIDERKRGEFASFKDLTERVKGLHNPQRLIAGRIGQELREENIKYRIWTMK